MSIELKQAAQQALDALIKSKNALEVLWVSHHANRTDYAIEDIDSAIKALRAAIEQAEAKTDEPVAWVVMNGLSKYQVCGAKAPADALCSEMQKRHDLSGSLAAFHVQPLYTHPAPGVPDDVVKDAERYRWLRVACFGGHMLGWNFNLNCDEPEAEWDAAIDAAMLASPAQKGGE